MKFYKNIPLLQNKSVKGLLGILFTFWSLLGFAANSDEIIAPPWWEKNPEFLKSTLFSRKWLPNPIPDAERTKFPHVRVFTWIPQKAAFLKQYFPLEFMNLSSNTSFENNNFKIYEAYSEQVFPLGYENQKPISLMFHLRFMEEYFKLLILENKTNPLFIEFNPKVKIRFDAKYNFSPFTYYDSKDKEYNIARTIPAVDPALAKDYLSKTANFWGPEIWFAPRLNIPILAPYMPDPIIDTAMCPDVIYHEYTHLLSGRFLGGNTIGSALSEGLSDYFAATVINYPWLYSQKTCRYKVRQYADRGFNVERFKKYKRSLEDQFDADFHFIPGLLWKIRSIVGPALSDMIVFRSMLRSNSQTLIFPHFVDLLQKAAGEMVGTQLKPVVQKKLEDEVFLPAGVFTRVSYAKTIMAALPHQKLISVNMDPYYLKLKQKYLDKNLLCQSKDHWELNFEAFRIDFPRIIAIWNCDDYKIPFVMKFGFDSPLDFILQAIEPNKKDQTVQTWSWSLASKKIKIKDPQHAYLLDFAQKHLMGEGMNGRTLYLNWHREAQWAEFSLKEQASYQSALNLRFYLKPVTTAR